MEAGKNEEIMALQQQRAELEKQSAELAQQKSKLEQQSAALEQQNTAIQQQVSILEQQKAALLAASQQRQYQNMLAVDLAEQIFFDSGRATLKAGGKDVLKKVGEALKGYENKVIRVVGHTDNVPLAKSLQGTFPTNS